MIVEAQVAARRAVAEEQEELARTLAAAFADDPVFAWVLRDVQTHEERLRRFFAIELRHVAFARGTVWTCEGWCGAAMCMPPGAWQLLRLAGSPPLRLMLRPARRQR